MVNAPAVTQQIVVPAATAVAILLAWRLWALTLSRRRGRRGGSPCADRPNQPRCIPRRYYERREAERAHLAESPEPFVLVGTPLGECMERWTVDYLTASAGDMRVSVHVSQSAGLNFVNKNYSYAMMTFGEFLQLAQESSLIPARDRSAYYYYRSMHPNRKLPSSLDIFGALAEEFSLPDTLLDGFQQHSSVLRVATAGMRMWLHYDICDNFLCCISGRKRVVLLHPCHVSSLYITGSSSLLGSRALERDEEKLRELWKEFPLAESAWSARQEIVLEEGDVLFIPALWAHCTEAVPAAAENCKPCVSVNVFLLRPERVNLHDRKDIWANRELLPAQAALKALDESVLPALRLTPPTFRAFYCRKAMAMLSAMLEEAEQEEAEESVNRASLQH